MGMGNIATQIEHDDVNEAQTPPSRKRMMGLAFILIIAPLILMKILVRTPSLQALPPTDIENNRAAYHRILGEAHTGLRLARLADFIEHTPDSPDISAARIQHATLHMHETKAWAGLSDTLYTLGASLETKTKARDLYVRIWSPLIRSAQLENLVLSPPVASEAALSFETASSTFTRGPITLAGGLEMQKQKPRAKLRRSQTTRNHSAHTQEVRIKRARKPVYPARAKRRGIEAVVVLSLTIDRRGRVVNTKVLKISAPRYRNVFMRAARRAAKRSRFHPKIIGGKPVETRNYKRTYKFTLGEEI